MSETYAPTGYRTLQPYLILTDAAAFMAFLTTVFDATERMVMRDSDGRVSHAEMQVGDCVLMLADEHPKIDAFAPPHYGGSPIKLMIYVKDCDATYKKALAAGAASEREPTDQPYGDRMSGVRDPFGYVWYIAHPLTKTEDMAL